MLYPTIPPLWCPLRVCSHTWVLLPRNRARLYPGSATLSAAHNSAAEYRPQKTGERERERERPRQKEKKKERERHRERTREGESTMDSCTRPPPLTNAVSLSFPSLPIFFFFQSAVYPTLDRGVAAAGDCLRKAVTPPVVVPTITGPPGSSSSRHDGSHKSWSGSFLPTMGRFPAGVCVCVCVVLVVDCHITSPPKV